MKYDPTKKYTWEPTQVFQLNGNEYGLLLNALRAVISTPEAQRIILAEKAHSLLEDILKKGVEDGFIREYNED